jgi:hypothetical protein
MRRLPLALGLLCLSACQCGPTLVNDQGLSFSPSSLDFGQLAPDTRSTLTVQVRNLGTHQASVSLTVVEASRAGAFWLPQPPTSVEPGATVDVAVTYLAGLAVSADVASLSVRDVDLDTDARVALLGRTGAAVDAGFDAGVDGGLDAGLDAGADAGFDAGFDAGTDAGVDAGFDAGGDAGSELPVFDGGGTCGNVNVLDLPLLAYPAPYNLDRTAPSIVPVGSDFALGWIESLPDAGSGLFFERVMPSARAVVAPTVLGASQGSEVRMAWNGKEFALTWDEPSTVGLTNDDVNVEFLDGHGALRPVTPLRIPGLYRPGMTEQVPVWDAHTQSWALAFGWWQTISQVNTGTSSLRHLDGGSFVGAQTDSLVEMPSQSTTFAAGLDGGYVLVGAPAVQPLVLRRLDDAFATVWSATLFQAFNGNSVRVVPGAASYGVAWVHYDGSTWGSWFAVVDAAGTAHPAVRVASAASSSHAIDVAWNGATYTTVVNTYSDAGWQLEETRFDESGAQQGARRLLTCGTEAVFDPRIAWNSGEHLVTYEVNNGWRRVLLFP